MKLKLTPQRDLYVLEVEGPVDLRGTAVLKAGLNRLLKSGKNRIAIDLAQATILDAAKAACWREVRDLNLLALELDGGIVLVGLTPELKADHAALGGNRAPFVAADVASASQHFAAAHKPIAEDPSIAHLNGSQLAAALSAEIAHAKKLEIDLRELKEKLLLKETGELQTLRREIATLQDRNEQLISQIEHMIIERRAPADLAGWQTKTQALEGELTEALKKLASDSLPKT